MIGVILKKFEPGIAQGSGFMHARLSGQARTRFGGGEEVVVAVAVAVAVAMAVPAAVAAVVLVLLLR